VNAGQRTRRYQDAVITTLLSLLCGLAVGAALIVTADEPTRTAMGYFGAAPADTFTLGWHAVSSGYAALCEGALFDPSRHGLAAFDPLANTLLNATPLILGGLAVGTAFRAGLFNIGVQGQLVMGAICAGYVGFAFHLPQPIALASALIAGMAGGAVWGAVSGWLKARTGAHEVITTIMMNYLALYLLSYLLSVPGFQAPGSHQAVSREVHSAARLPLLLGSGSRLHAGLLIALAAAAVCWWLLSRSTLGFKLRTVGANKSAARTAGIRVERTYVIAMVISGALAGLVGCSQALGTNHALTGDIDAGLGFQAITVALLGRASPVGTVLAGLLFGAFNAGGVVMVADTGVPSDAVSVIEAVIVLFVAAPALIRSLFQLRGQRDGSTGAGQFAKGWNG
jgi:general nucleoside transport system permease protein